MSLRCGFLPFSWGFLLGLWTDGDFCCGVEEVDLSGGEADLENAAELDGLIGWNAGLEGLVVWESGEDVGFAAEGF